jgi:hypothetical protein
MSFRNISSYYAFSESALVADFPLLFNEILLPNLVFFSNLFRHTVSG